MSLLVAVHPDGQGIQGILVIRPFAWLESCPPTSSGGHSRGAPRITGTVLLPVSEEDSGSSAVRQSLRKPRLRGSPACKPQAVVPTWLVVGHSTFCTAVPGPECCVCMPAIRDPKRSLETDVQAPAALLAAQLFPAELDCCNLEGSFAPRLLSTLISQVA